MTITQVLLPINSTTFSITNTKYRYIFDCHSRSSKQNNLYLNGTAIQYSMHAPSCMLYFGTFTYIISIPYTHYYVLYPIMILFLAFTGLYWLMLVGSVWVSPIRMLVSRINCLSTKYLDEIASMHVILVSLLPYQLIYG